MLKFNAGYVIEQIHFNCMDIFKSPIRITSIYQNKKTIIFRCDSFLETYLYGEIPL